MSAPAYESYKSCKFGALDQLPTHWDLVPLKVVMSLEMGQSPSSDDCNIDGVGHPFLQGCAEFGKVHPTPIQYCDVPKKIARKGDILFSVRAPVGAMNLADADYGIGRGLCAISPTACDNRYAFWALNYSRETLNSIATGSTYSAVSIEQLASTRLPLPTPTEQTAIAAFLDRETGKIDALIEAQTRLIELLKEKRQAVISHAVTKGLNPDAPMKDSGIEWLGQVPAHWDVTALKRFITILSGYAFPSAGFTTDESDVRLLRGANIGIGCIRWDDVVYWPEVQGLEEFSLAPGDIVLGMDRPWISGGLRIAKLQEADCPSLLLQRVTRLKPTPELDPDYLYSLLVGEAFYHHCAPDMTGVSVPHISPSQVEDFRVPIPPESEQREIASFITRKSSEFNELIGHAQSAIKLLQERRAGLISAAVTGKIDVRGLVNIESEAA